MADSNNCYTQLMHTAEFEAFYSKPLLPGLGVDSPFNSGPAKANLQKDTIRQREASRPMARSFFTPLPKSKGIYITLDI